MSDHVMLSPAAWTLLDLLQQHLGVSIELFDASLRPLLQGTAAETESSADDPAIAADAVKSLRTGDVHVNRAAPRPVGIFPLRVARRVVGCLIVSRGGGAAAAPAPDLEAAGHLARTALESDLLLGGQLEDTRHRNRRLHGVLRFLLQLAPAGAERDAMNAVIQAASVWFDVDCRIYQRETDGGFVLAAALPGAEPRPAAGRLDLRRAERLLAARRFRTGGEGDELGVGGRGEEVLVLPVGAPPPEWLLVLSGGIDTDVDLTFSAIARVLAGDLRAAELARVEYWQRRLAATAEDTRRAPERVLLELLEVLTTDTEATSGRVALVTGGAERALAMVGQAPDDDGERAAVTGGTEPTRAEKPWRQILEPVDIGPDTKVTVSLTCPADRAPRAGVELRRFTTALRPWLIGAVAALTRQGDRFGVVVEPTSFEHRIQEEVERAKRFNLGLGLVVIGAEDGPAADTALEGVASALRSELRASDLLGRIREGMVALVLVHSESMGTDSVVTRVRQRLEMLAGESPVAAIQLGKAVFSAECATAEALIREALARAQRLELRN